MRARTAFAVAAALAVVSCSGAVEPATTTVGDVSSTSQVTSTTTQRPTTTTEQSSVTTTTTSDVTPTSDDGTVVEISVDEDQVEGGGQINIDQGTNVRIVVVSDVADEAHLHGYDLTADVGPGAEGVIEFVADIPGIFELELEQSGLELGRLQVAP